MKSLSKQSLISCIIPSYKGQDYIISCVDSVIKQNYLPKEIILVIQKSSEDHSYNLCLDKYKHLSYVHIYLFEKSMYPGVARNIGIGLSHGKFICILDDDDMLDDSDFFSKSIDFLSKNRHYGLVSPISKILFNGIERLYRDKGSLRLDVFSYSHSGTIFLRSLAQKISFYNPLYRFYEDLDFYLRMASLTKIYNIHLFVLKRLDPQSVSYSFSSFEEFICWFRVVFPYITKYPGFILGLAKKIIKIPIPRRIQLRLLTIFLRF